jgi:hypothetical protein
MEESAAFVRREGVNPEIQKRIIAFAVTLIGIAAGLVESTVLLEPRVL